MKFSNWSILGFACSILFTIISIYRYWFIYQDIDKFVAYTTIGILIFAVSFLYNKSINHGNTLEALEEYIVDKGGKK
jgi:hypothetical protein